MPIKPEDAVKTFGFSSEDLEKFDKPEDFKAAIDKRFIARDMIADDESIMSEMRGRINGPYQTKLIQVLRESGVEFEEGDIKDKKIPEIAQLGISKINKKYQSELESLKSASSGKEGLEQAMKKWELEKDKIIKERDEFKSLHEKSVGEVENLMSKFGEEKKNWRVDQKWKELLSGVKYKTEGLDEHRTNLLKSGFEGLVRSTYKLDLDEQGNPVILNQADGKKVESSDTAGKLLAPEEAIKNLAVKQGVWSDNAHGGKKVVTMKPAFGTQSASNGEGRHAKQLT